jgi:hypothetical protein
MAKRRKDGDEPAATLESRYDEELLSANWNPVIDLLGASCDKTREELSRSDPARNAAQEDPDAFLSRIYKLGS